MRLHVSILSRGDHRDVDATLRSVSDAADVCSVSVDDDGVDERATHVMVLTAGVVARPGIFGDLARSVDASPGVPLTFRVDRVECQLDRYRAASMDWSGLVFDLHPAPDADPSSAARILELGPDRAIVPVGSEAPADRIRRIGGPFKWIRHYDRACLVAPHDVPRAARPSVFRQHWSPAFQEPEDAFAWAFEMAPGPTPYADNLVELLDIAGHHPRSMAGTGERR